MIFTYTDKEKECGIMEKLQIAICEDDPAEAEKLIALIESEDTPVQIATYRGG